MKIDLHVWIHSPVDDEMAVTLTQIKENEEAILAVVQEILGKIEGELGD